MAIKVHVGSRAMMFHSPRGGLERAAGDHVRILRELGITVCLHTPSAAETEPGVIHRPVPWPVQRIRPGMPGFALVYAIWTRGLADSLAGCWATGDAIHLHGSSSYALTQVQLPLALSSVVNPHGMEEFTPGTPLQELNRRVSRRMGRAGARTAKLVISTDRSMTPQVIRNFGISSDAIVEIPNSIDVERADELAKLGRNEQVAQSSGAIVTVGRLAKNKGYDNLARAFAQLETTGEIREQTTWYHYGAGAEASTVSAIMRKCKFIRLLIIEGATDATIAHALRTCTLFVQPSRHEGSSLTTLEAMAQEALIVATPVGGIPDKIIDGVTGILATDTSHSSIASAISRAKAFDARTLGEAARQLVVRSFSHQSAKAAYAEIYTRVTG